MTTCLSKPAARRVAFAVVLVAALGVAAGCAQKDTSRRIAVDVNGEILNTAFRFNSFRETLQREHGEAYEAEDLYLKSDSVEVYFRKLEDGRLLADRVTLRETLDTLDPA